MTVRVSRSVAEAPLRLEPDAVTWAGRACSTPDAPLLAVRVEGARLHRALSDGDALAVDGVVPELAVPGGFLAAMAEHCSTRDAERALAVATGRLGMDLRWRNALFAAAASRGGVFDAPTLVEPTIVFAPTKGLRATHTRQLPSGRLAVLEQWELYADRPKLVQLWLIEPGGERRLVHSLERGNSVSVSLLTPTLRGDASSIVLAAHDQHRGALAVHFFAEDGRYLRSSQVGSRPPVSEYSGEGNIVFLHGDRHHLAFDSADPGHATSLEPVLPESPPPPPRLWLDREAADLGRVLFVGDRLASAGPVSRTRESTREFTTERENAASPGADVIVASQELTLCDLSLREPPIRHLVRGEIRHLQATPGALWLTVSDRGICRVTPQAGLECVLEERGDGLLVRASGELLFGSAQNEVVCFELGNRRVRYRTKVDPGILAIEPAPAGGAIVSCVDRSTWLDATGAILATSAEGRSFDSGSATMRDGTVAFSAGHEVLVIGADGAVRRRLAMPSGGRIVGATQTRFLFGRLSGGWTPVEPDAISAIDSAGAITSRVNLVRKEGAHAFVSPRRLTTGGEARDFGTARGDDLFLLREDGAIGQWTVSSPGKQSSAPEPTELRVLRDTTSEKGHTINPRDEWPEPGVDIAGGAFFATGCTFGGTTGVSPGPAILVHDGAVATLVRCRLSNGEHAHLQHGSTAVLIECQLDRAEQRDDWQLHRGSHLVLLDCKLSGPLQVRLAEGASVIAPGHQLVRLHDLVTITPFGVGPPISR